MSAPSTPVKPLLFPYLSPAKSPSQPKNDDLYLMPFSQPKMVFSPSKTSNLRTPTITNRSFKNQNQTNFSPRFLVASLAADEPLPFYSQSQPLRVLNDDELFRKPSPISKFNRSYQGTPRQLISNLTTEETPKSLLKGFTEPRSTEDELNDILQEVRRVTRSIDEREAHARNQDEKIAESISSFEQQIANRVLLKQKLESYLSDVEKEEKQIALIESTPEDYFTSSNNEVKKIQEDIARFRQRFDSKIEEDNDITSFIRYFTTFTTIFLLIVLFIVGIIWTSFWFSAKPTCGWMEIGDYMIKLIGGANNHELKNFEDYCFPHNKLRS